MSAAQIWLLHSAVAAGGGVSITIFANFLSRVLGSGGRRPMRPSAMTVEVET